MYRTLRLAYWLNSDSLCPKNKLRPLDSSRLERNGSASHETKKKNWNKLFQNHNKTGYYAFIIIA